MYKILLIIIVILSLTGNIFSSDPGINNSELYSTSVANSNLKVNQYRFSLDKLRSSSTGSHNVLAIHKKLIEFEDKYIGHKWFNEDKALNKLGGIGLRLSKRIFLDMPIDIFTIVFAHEYYGHGFRYRELDFEDVEYEFYGLFPYGDPGAAAKGSNTKGALSDHDLLAMWSSGMETSSLIQKNLNFIFIKSGEINYRQAEVYFFSFNDMFGYIQGLSNDMTTDDDGHDVYNYLKIINEKSGYNNLSEYKLTPKELKKKALLNLANPFLFYSLYTTWKTYLWGGEKSFKYPTIKLGQVEYLPSCRISLTPFGAQYHWENYLKSKDKIFFLDIHKGSTEFHSSWGGVSFNMINAYKRNNYSFDFNLEIWNQPDLERGSGNIINTDKGGIGFFTGLTNYFKFGKHRLISEIGYKTAGFMEGRPMNSSIILNLGIGF